MLDVLEQFTSWFLQQPLILLSPVQVYHFDPVDSLVLYRKPPFQVELFVIKNDGGFPEEHRHPDVDTIEVHLCGDIPLTINGKPPQSLFVPRPPIEPLCLNRIRPTDYHGAEKVPGGGAFLSIQHWLNGVTPTSVGLNWEGSPTSLTHAELLDRPATALPTEKVDAFSLPEDSQTIGGTN